MVVNATAWPVAHRKHRTHNQTSKNKQSEAAEPVTQIFFFPPLRLDWQLGHVRVNGGLWLLAASRDKKEGRREDKRIVLIFAQTHISHFLDLEKHNFCLFFIDLYS